MRLWSIGTKITVPMIFIILFTGYASIFLAESTLEDTIGLTIREKGEAVTRHLAIAAQKAVVDDDRLELQTLVDEKHQAIEDVSYAFITDDSDNILAHTFSGGFPFSLLWENRITSVEEYSEKNVQLEGRSLNDFAVPIVSENGTIFLGTARVGISEQSITAAINELTQNLILPILIIIALGVLISISLTWLIVKPIRQLQNSSQIIAETGNLEHQIDLKSGRLGSDEIGALAQSFNEMIRRLKEKSDELQTAHDELELRVLERTAALQEALDSIQIEVDKRKAAEEDLKETAAELARSNRDLEDFAYIASHDLKAPLRTIGSYIHLLERRYKSELDEEAQEFIKFAQNGVKRMQNLINDLLSYSRVGTHGKEFTPTDFQPVIERVLFNLQKSVEETGAVITHTAMPTIAADKQQMIQLFQNLISNAIKFCKGQSPIIKVSARLQSQEWVFAVSDNGIGIESQYQDRIFQMFQRLHSKKDFPGTGIGLAICKRIVERHKGHIWVESEPGEGSTFYFAIPVKKGVKHE
ncbi:MAG: sensor histidine kinase [Candidatus Hodarchaeales archaeon]